jgi:hypothetical protein
MYKVNVPTRGSEVNKQKKTNASYRDLPAKKAIKYEKGKKLPHG